MSRGGRVRDRAQRGAGGRLDHGRAPGRGLNKTIFEGPVTTSGHDIAKDSSGAHHCDGTNNGSGSSPGATMTSALDDASRTGAFSWDGTYFASFDDFGVDRVGPDAANSSQFWGYALNFQASSVGGCQQKVSGGDDVLFAFDFFSKSHLLRPERAGVGGGWPALRRARDRRPGRLAHRRGVGGRPTPPRTARPT